MNKNTIVAWLKPGIEAFLKSMSLRLTAQPINICTKIFDHLCQLYMTDSLSGKTAVDIELLIGADYYWDLATGHT